MKSLYTFNEIIDKINSHDYNTEMMLQHLIVRYKELEKERDEAREEAETFREISEHRELRDGLFPWEEGTE